jgi:DNA repair photolyase
MAHAPATNEKYLNPLPITPLGERMSRMFQVNGKATPTINPIKGGCKHDCSYCYRKNNRARKFYQGEPRFCPEVLKKKIGKNETYFMVSMNDMWQKDIPLDWIHAILDWCSRQDPSNTILFLTKNPIRYRMVQSYYHQLFNKPNFVYGVTLESDIDVICKKMSHAPPPIKRIEEMVKLKGVRKFVSIEPICEFSCSFAERVREIAPEFVYLGYNNWIRNAHLLEPSLSSTRYLISQLYKFTEVREKTIREAIT